MPKLNTLKPRVNSVFLGVRQHSSYSNRSTRSYNPSSVEWRRRRAETLKRDMYRCQGYPKGKHALGCNGIANEVDHIDGDAGNNPDDLSNYQSLSKQCHSTKTAKENSGFASGC